MTIDREGKKKKKKTYDAVSRFGYERLLLIVFFFFLIDFDSSWEISVLISPER